MNITRIIFYRYFVIMKNLYLFYIHFNFFYYFILIFFIISRVIFNLNFETNLYHLQFIYILIFIYNRLNYIIKKKK